MSLGLRQEEIIKILLDKLNEEQIKPVLDTEGAVLVIAGAGSGKTRVLVHKLASLLLLEDVKHEQLLMLTFSRAAATEFKKRYKQLPLFLPTYGDIFNPCRRETTRIRQQEKQAHFRNRGVHSKPLSRNRKFKRTCRTLFHHKRIPLQAL